MKNSTLHLQPVAHNVSKLYCLKPEGSIGNLVFSRASTGNRHNKEGLIEQSAINTPRLNFFNRRKKYFKNLITSSSDFVYGWNESDATLFPNAIENPVNNKVDAVRIEDSSVLGGYVLPKTNASCVANQKYTFSCYVKFDTSDYFTLRPVITGGTTIDARTIFKSDGTITCETGGTTLSTMTALGNTGWFRVSTVVQVGASSNAIQFRLQPAFTNGDGCGAVATATGAVFVYGCQIEEGTSVTAYEERNSVEDYVIESDKSCPSLLLEKASTNLVQRSEEVDNAYWNKANLTITTNQAVAPDGKLSADKIASTTANAGHQFNRVVGGLTGSSQYTWSCFVKAGTNERVLIRSLGQTSGDDNQVEFNIKTGRKTRVWTDASIVHSGIEPHENGWFRIWLSITNATDTGIQFFIQMLEESDSLVFTGTEKHFYAWGMQLELNQVASSYIKTTSSTVARSADVCNGAGDASTFNSEEGVLYAEMSAHYDNITQRGLAISNGSTTNRVELRYNTVSGEIRGIVAVGGVNQGVVWYSSANLDITDFHKIALKWKLNDFALWIDGVEVHTDNTGSVPSANVLDEFRFDSGGGASNMYANIKEVKVFDIALTDEELQTLTG